MGVVLSLGQRDRSCAASTAASGRLCLPLSLWRLVTLGGCDMPVQTSLSEGLSRGRSFAKAQNGHEAWPGSACRWNSR